MTNNKTNSLNNYLELSKLKIMIPVSLTGFTGYFLYSPVIDQKIILTSIGILLIAVSASVLNQIQEVETDKRMERTSDRPIPSGKISRKRAFFFFLLNFLAGMVILYLFGNLRAVIIAFLTVLWYNGVYTYLKRVTAFAVVPGAITGALPPLIGWVAAGGGEFDRIIVFVEFLLFTGQIPHFWLLIMKYGEQYREAGLPSLTGIFSLSQVTRLAFSWVVFSVIAALFLCYFEIIRNSHVTWILIIASVILIWQFSDLLKNPANAGSKKKYSVLLNAYFLLILLLLIADRIIS